jgi:hypothetical protein
MAQVPPGATAPHARRRLSDADDSDVPAVASSPLFADAAVRERRRVQMERLADTLDAAAAADSAGDGNKAESTAAKAAPPSTREKKNALLPWVRIQHIGMHEPLCWTGYNKTYFDETTKLRLPFPRAYFADERSYIVIDIDGFQAESALDWAKYHENKFLCSADSRRNLNMWRGASVERHGVLLSLLGSRLGYPVTPEELHGSRGEYERRIGRIYAAAKKYPEMRAAYDRPSPCPPGWTCPVPVIRGRYVKDPSPDAWEYAFVRVDLLGNVLPENDWLIRRTKAMADAMAAVLPLQLPPPPPKRIPLEQVARLVAEQAPLAQYKRGLQQSDHELGDQLFTACVGDTARGLCCQCLVNAIDRRRPTTFVTAHTRGFTQSRTNAAFNYLIVCPTCNNVPENSNRADGNSGGSHPDGLALLWEQGDAEAGKQLGRVCAAIVRVAYETRTLDRRSGWDTPDSIVAALRGLHAHPLPGGYKHASVEQALYMFLQRGREQAELERSLRLAARDADQAEQRAQEMRRGQHEYEHALEQHRDQPMHYMPDAE